MNTAPSVCVADFCGRLRHNGYDIYPYQEWADWWPDQKVVTFGGAWSEGPTPVPDMPANIKPSEAVIQAWIDRHWSVDRWLAGYLASINI